MIPEGAQHRVEERRHLLRPARHRGAPRRLEQPAGAAQRPGSPGLARLAWRAREAPAGPAPRAPAGAPLPGGRGARGRHRGLLGLERRGAALLHAGRHVLGADLRGLRLPGCGRVPPGRQRPAPRQLPELVGRGRAHGQARAGLGGSIFFVFFVCLGRQARPSVLDASHGSTYRLFPQI